MEVQKEYWAALKYKYEEKNQTLEQKEQELRARLEALERVLGQSGQHKGSVGSDESNPISAINFFSYSIAGDPAAVPDERCTPVQPEEEKGGFLKCICSMLPMGKPKNPPAPNDTPTKEVRDCKPQKLSEDSSCPTQVECKGRIAQANRSEAIREEACKGLCDFSQPKKSGSSGSLKSLDLFYMQNIQNLAEKQKDLIRQISDLDNKSKIYEAVLKEYKNVDFSKADSDCPCAQDRIKTDEADKRTNAELKLENLLLKNELKDMRLEVRQYLEKMEGPIQFKIESEKFKNQQLEQKLKETLQELAKTRSCYEEEICRLKIQICNATTKINKLTKCNQKLCQDLKCCQAKCAQLEDEIIRLKISEAETLKRLKACIEAQNTECPPEECNLYEIARELSKLIKECEPCGECSKLPEDLTQAAKLLKSLTDLVDQKFPEDENQLGSCLASCATDNKPKESMKTSSPCPQIKSSPFRVPPKKSSIFDCRDPCGKPPSCTNIRPVEPRPMSCMPQTIAPTVCSVPQFEPNYNDGGDCLCDQQMIVPESVENSCSCSPPLQELYPPITIEPLSAGCCCVTGTQPLPAPQPTVGNSCSCSGDDAVKEFIPAASYNKIECSCSVFADMKKAAEEKPDLSCYCSDKEPVAAPAPPANDTDNCACSEPPKKQAPPQKVDKNEEDCSCDDKKGEVERLYPTTSDRLKLSHQVTASRSKDILKSATSVKCVKVNDNFPYDIDTRVDVIDKPPDGVHVSTTITKSGCLEVVTEGPEGVIETTLIYTNSGNVEVVTEILEYSKKTPKCNLAKLTAGSCKPPGGKVPMDKCLEAPTIPRTSDYEDCECAEGCPVLEEKPLGDSVEENKGRALTFASNDDNVASGGN